MSGLGPPATRTRVDTKNTADLVILTVRESQLKVLLVVRGTEPYKGQLALPGGFLRPNEDLEAAALRELLEETDLDGSKLPLQQLRTYSKLGRDPRGVVVSTAFVAIAPHLPVPLGGTDASRADWVEVEDTLPSRLAFDHGVILNDAIIRVQAEIERTPLAASFCSDEFTIPELRRIFELIWRVPIDPGNFRHKVVDVIEDFVVPTGRRRRNPEGGRPAEIYRLGSAQILYPPILRPR